MKISIIGDICLGRMVNSVFNKKKFQIVDQEIIDALKKSDFVIANLESPICKDANTDGDHLSFKGTSNMLSQFKFINYFSLSNNHINDCGTLGMEETMMALDKNDINYNGLFQNTYTPITINRGGEKIAIFTCTDMMNISFSEGCKWKTLRIDDSDLNDLISKYKKEDYFIILFAHVGILFSRFVNPPVRKMLHEKIDCGADVIVTAHAHCLGGMEYYKGKPIFHSLGDFVMDGGSYRRRRSAILNLEISNHSVSRFKIIPTITNNQLRAILPSEEIKKRMLKSWEFVSAQMKKHELNYSRFFKFQYKIEMIQHTISTLKFLYDVKGFIGMAKLVTKRYEEVRRMGTWISKNRSGDRRDDEAIRKDRKKFSQEELFN